MRIYAHNVLTSFCTVEVQQINEGGGGGGADRRTSPGSTHTDNVMLNFTCLLSRRLIWVDIVLQWYNLGI